MAHRLKQLIFQFDSAMKTPATMRAVASVQVPQILVIITCIGESIARKLSCTKAHTGNARADSMKLIALVVALLAGVQTSGQGEIWNGSGIILQI